jgi:uncharacterized membrane protein YfhO
VSAGANGYTFHATASNAAILVVSQTRYPGWKAIVDDKETPVFRANFAFSGIVIPAGGHQVRFVYEPRSFRIGVVISGVSVLVLAGLGTINRRRDGGK